MTGHSTPALRREWTQWSATGASLALSPQLHQMMWGGVSGGLAPADQWMLVDLEELPLMLPACLPIPAGSGPAFMSSLACPSRHSTQIMVTATEHATNYWAFAKAFTW